MKSKIILPLITILSIGLSSFFYYKNIKIKESFITREENYLRNIDICQNFLDKFSSTMLFQIKDEGLLLDNNIILKDEIDNEITLDSLINKKDKLVLRFSELNCQTCVEKQIEELNYLKENIGLENLILITSYSKKRDLIKFKKINKIKHVIYRTSESGLGLNMESLNSPFYFIISKKNIVNSLFLPAKEAPQITKKYIDIIKYKLKSNSV